MKQNIINDKHGWKHKLTSPPSKMSMYANIPVGKQETSPTSTASSSKKSSYATNSLPRNFGIFSGIRKYANRSKEKKKTNQTTPSSPKVSFKSDIDVKIYDSASAESLINDTNESLDSFESNDMNNNDGDFEESNDRIEHLSMELNILKEANTYLEMELRYLQVLDA